MMRWTHAALLTLLAGAAPLAAQQPMAGMAGMSGTTDTAQIAATKAALAKYQDPFQAVRDGYFSTVACMDFPRGGEGHDMHYRPGAMGVHFLNMSLIGPTLDPLKPQVLIYEQVGNTLKLAGAEWFMPAQLSATAPTLFGRTLDGPMEGHAPIMPPELHHWDLHVWLWKANPAGMFSSTNPAVHCPSGPLTVRGDAPHMVQQ